MKGFRKRIACVILALFVAGFSLLSHPIKARASAISAFTAAESAESFMILLDMLYNAMLVGGAAESASDYDSDMSLLDAFLNFANKSLGIPEAPEAKFYLQDGSCITVEEFVSTYTDGTGALQLPDKDTWSNYRVIDGGSSGEPSGQEPEEPEEPNKPLFTQIQTFIMNSGFIAMIGEFISDLWNGDIEGLDPADYFDYSYCGSDYTAPINNIVLHFRGVSKNVISNESVNTSEAVLNMNCGISSDTYLCFIKDSTNYGGLQICYGSYVYNANSQTFVRYNNFTLNGLYDIYEGYNDNLEHSTSICNNIYTIYVNVADILENNLTHYKTTEFYTNIPMFDSQGDALTCFRDGNISGVINKNKYEYPVLIESVPNALAPLADLELAPDSLPALNNALASAVESYPLPDIEPAENAVKYKDAVKVVVDDYVSSLPEAEPEPSPEPEPTPEPEPEPGTGGDSEIDTYKRNLSGLFPFCLPFDLISLLDALDAEPVAPCFEIPFVVDALDISMKVELDLSFLDEVAELIRIFETIGFIITLIMVTHKLIKW